MKVYKAIRRSSMHGLCCILLVCISLSVDAQFTRYIIELKDKRGTTGSLANPSTYLSSRAIERRMRTGIAIDSTDLPVSAQYLSGIAAVPNVTILNSSKWLNQVCIRADAGALANVQALPFVKNTAAVAPRLAQPGSQNPSIETAVTEVIGANRRQASSQATNLNYGRTLPQVHIHNGEYLHNQGLTGMGMRIAILDAGFAGYKTNPAFDSVRLQNRVLGEWDFVANEQSVNEDDAHGMYCFSIIAANRPGAMVGSGPHASFYLYRTEDSRSEYPVEEQNWVAAAERADSIGADMIASSLGYADFDNPAFNHSYAQRNGNTTIITRGADLAAKKGMIVMNSAGNSGAEQGDGRFISCPADGDSVVSVGAIDTSGKIANFSSWGPSGAGKIKPSVVSVGVGTILAGQDGSVSSGNGTSYSNPNLAGLVASLWQAFPTMSNMQIIDAVQRSADRYANPDNRFGYGIPDFKKAFAILVTKSFSGNVSVSNCNSIVTWFSADNQTMRYEIEKRTGNETTYRNIATVTGKAGAIKINNYSFTDNDQPTNATPVRYRIKQILPQDSSVVVMDTSFTYASTCVNPAGISVAPNPVSNSINLRLNIEAVPSLSVALYNVLGQRIYYYETRSAGGSFTHQIPAAKLARGVYIVTVRSDRKMLYSGKVVK